MSDLLLFRTDAPATGLVEDAGTPQLPGCRSLFRFHYKLRGAAVVYKLRGAAVVRTWCRHRRRGALKPAPIRSAPRMRTFPAGCGVAPGSCPAPPPSSGTRARSPGLRAHSCAETIAPCTVATAVQGMFRRARGQGALNRPQFERSTATPPPHTMPRGDLRSRAVRTPAQQHRPGMPDQPPPVSHHGQPTVPPCALGHQKGALLPQRIRPRPSHPRRSRHLSAIRASGHPILLNTQGHLRATCVCFVYCE